MLLENRNMLRRGLSTLRNIGISAHIDSGKTTFTERVLFYTGRIASIHDVRGRDGIGATMDSMALEREKGITIQSAATHAKWGDCNVNIIDTPGHVDFTIEVERALRVLDGAVMVLCSVGGVQSQTSTVDRQMKRYNVPRISFINKMDRMGANPWRVIEQMRNKLAIGVAAVQVPIGAEDGFEGVVDLVTMRAIRNEGAHGETIVETDEIPAHLLELAIQKRTELIETLSDYDEQIADMFLSEQEPSSQQLKEAIRRATLSLKFTPVFMGSAFKNKCVQPVLDGVVDYLPAPSEKINMALDLSQNESQVELTTTSHAPLVSLAFKLEDTKFGQLTYVRVYQGSLRKGMVLHNTRLDKKVKLSKLVRMHSNEMEEVDLLPAGEIGALFGLECASGDTLTDADSTNLAMSSMYVPDPVVSYSLRPVKKDSTNFSRALQKFIKEDPTFRAHLDPESRETIISGMGELHLDIYVERMKREYNCECVVGQPQVAYRETILDQVPYNYTHKKQSGGAGQYGKILGYIEPMTPPDSKYILENAFEDKTVGMNVPSQYIPSVEKGFLEGCERGGLAGQKCTGIRFVLEDGGSHSVDSSDLAFRLAALGAFRDAYMKARPLILEPIMNVTVSYPQEFQANVMAQINKRRGMISDTEVQDGFGTLHADVPLGQMFGYVTDLRSATQGKGEFTMEYKMHQPLTRSEQEAMVQAYQKERQQQQQQ